MRNDLIVSQSILINASIEKVWEALISPAIIKKYLFGTNTITDWKVGSKIIFQGEYEGNTYKDKGVIKENKLHETLSYSYWSGFSGVEDKPENYSTVTYKVKSISPTQTEFTWTQSGYATEDGYNHSLSGMSAFLEQMKNVIESE